MFRRMYHVSSVVHSLKKQGIKLNKMLNPSSKRNWYPEMSAVPTLLTVKGLTKVKREPGKQGLRRLAMLNKLFMKQITDILSTGTVSVKVLGRGIEISKVQITPDFQTVNVFWVCKGSASDDETEAILNKVAGPLRNELSTLRVMGEVPYIVFVKDKQEAQLVELDRRLAVADYGDDYETTEIGHLLKSEFTLNTKLSPEMKAKIKQLEEEAVFLEEPIPDMTNNVFGLEHSKIMSRLLAARKTSRDAWASLEEGTVVTYRASPTASPVTDHGDQKQELAEFLRKRQIEQNKAQKKIHAAEDWRSALDDDESLEMYEDSYDDDDDSEEYDDEDNYIIPPPDLDFARVKNPHSD